MSAVLLWLLRASDPAVFSVESESFPLTCFCRCISAFGCWVDSGGVGAHSRSELVTVTKFVLTAPACSPFTLFSLLWWQTVKAPFLLNKESCLIHTTEGRLRDQAGAFSWMTIKLRLFLPSQTRTGLDGVRGGGQRSTPSFHCPSAWSRAGLRPTPEPVLSSKPPHPLLWKYSTNLPNRPPITRLQEPLPSWRAAGVTWTRTAAPVYSDCYKHTAQHMSMQQTLACSIWALYSW